MGTFHWLTHFHFTDFGKISPIFIPMKFRKTFKNYLLVIVLFALAVSACHDKSGQTVTTTTTTTNIPAALTVPEDSGLYAFDLSTLEWMNLDVISMATVAGTTFNGSLLRTTVSGCATVGTDTVSIPHQIVIRFGASDCACLDSRSRRGNIVVSFTGHFNDSGAVHTITYDNYFIEDMQLTGQKVMTNMGRNASGQPVFSVTMNDSLVNASRVTSWTGSRVVTQTAGYATADRIDDVFKLTGSTVLDRANGHVFNYNITAPLQMALGCVFVESGVASVTSSVFTNGTRTLDFGAGACDNLVWLTIDTAVYNITIQ